MEKYENIQIRDDENHPWRSGYIYLTSFNERAVVAYKDNSAIMLKEFYRPMPFIPEPGQAIKVSQNNGVFSAHKFIAMDGDLYICEQRIESNGSKVYISWTYCGGLADEH